MTNDANNAHSHNSVRGQYAGFSQIRSHIRIRGMDGRGWGVGMGCQWLARLVSRVYLYVIWMGGAGGGGVANG